MGCGLMMMILGVTMTETIGAPSQISHMTTRMTSGHSGCTTGLNWSWSRTWLQAQSLRLPPNGTDQARAKCQRSRNQMAAGHAHQTPRSGHRAFGRKTRASTKAELAKCKGAHYKVDDGCKCNRAREENKTAHKKQKLAEAKEACHFCWFFKTNKATKNRCQQKCHKRLRGGKRLSACPKPCTHKH